MLLPGGVEVELLGAGEIHDKVEEEELAGSESADHHATGAEADGAELDEADLLGDVHQTGGDAAGAASARLVHLGEESVSGVGDDGGGNTGNHTGAEGDGELGGSGELGSGLARRGREDLRSASLHGELGHGVGHLLEQDGAEARVEATHEALLLDELGSGGGEVGGEGGLGDEADAGGLEGAEEHVRDELGSRGSAEVDGVSVVPGLLLAEALGHLDLEELHTSELEPT